MSMEPMESMNALYEGPFVLGGLLLKEDPPPNGGSGPDRPGPVEDDPPPNGKPEPAPQ